MITIEEVADKLLKEGLHLTALELQSELMRNQGQEVSLIRDYFSKREKSSSQSFSSSTPIKVSTVPQDEGKQQQLGSRLDSRNRSPSMQTFDSLDLGRCSDDGTDTLEKIALLEFELRKAKDTIKSLRSSLTEATTIAEESTGSTTTITTTGEEVSGERITAMDNDPFMGSNGNHSIDLGVIKPHEKRALNFLVNEFLMRHHHKMTSITFSEEITDQDFDSWEEIGLDIPQPPDLLTLMRSYFMPKQESILSKGTRKPSLCFNESSSQTDPIEWMTTDKTETDVDTTGRLTLDTNEKLTLDTNERLTLDTSTQTEELDERQVARKKMKEIISENCNINSIVDGDDSPIELSPFQVTLKEEAGLFEPRINTNLQVSRIPSDPSGIIDHLCHELPKIVPNVIIAKRTDLVPILISTIKLSKSSEEREKLVQVLFNLVRSPTREERDLILESLIIISRDFGYKKVEEEILPLIWEEMNEKYLEKRILVIESIHTLIPFVSKNIRISLLYSILVQIIGQDSELVVKENAIRVLSFLLTFFSSSDDEDGQKMDSVFKNIFIKTLISLDEISDPISMELISTINQSLIKYLIPSIAFWALKTNKLQFLINILLTETMNLLERKNTSERTIVSLINSFESLIPFLFINLVSSNPVKITCSGSANQTKCNRQCTIRNRLLNVKKIFQADCEISSLIQSFDSYISRDWFKTWPSWDDLLEGKDSTMYKFIHSIVSKIQLRKKQSVGALISFFTSFVQHFGLEVVRSKIKGMFLKRIYSQLDQDDGEKLDLLHNPILPCFSSSLTSLKPIEDEEQMDLVNCLQKSIITMSMFEPFDRPSLEAVQVSINVLMDSCSENCDQVIKIILFALQETVSDSRIQVRRKSLDLITCFINSSIKKSLNKESSVLIVLSIMRVLDTVSSDENVHVRSTSIPCFGSLFCFVFTHQINLRRELDEKVTMDKINYYLNEFLEGPKNRDEQIVLVSLINIFSSTALFFASFHEESNQITNQNVSNTNQNLSNPNQNFSNPNQNVSNPMAEFSFYALKLFLDFSLPRLAAIAVQCNNSTTLTREKKVQIVSALVDCYANYSRFSSHPETGIDHQLVKESILPSLKVTRDQVMDLIPDKLELLYCLINDFERRINPEGMTSSLSRSSFKLPVSAKRERTCIRNHNSYLQHGIRIHDQSKS